MAYQKIFIHLYSGCSLAERVFILFQRSFLDFQCRFPFENKIYFLSSFPLVVLQGAEGL